MKSKHPLFSLCLKHLLLGLFVFCSLGHVHAQNGPDCANSLCFGPGTSYSANSDLTITANQYYSYMQIKTNRTLTVKAGFTLYVGPVGTGAETEVFDLQNNGIIIVESGATLVIYGKLNNSNNSTTFTVDGTLIVYGNIYSGNGTQIVGTGSVSATGTITGGGSVLGTPATCSTGPCNSCTPLANSISSSQSYCTATTPTVFTGTDIPSATYQWAKSTTSATIGFANISGATSKDYTSASVSATTYFIRYATVGTCVYVSNVATVSIGSTALSITTPPATSSACDGSAESFSVVASGASLTYKWQQDPNTGFFADITDGGVFSGSTTTSLSISNVSGLNNYKYRVIVASACGTPASATSSSATLTVNANPTSAVLANGTGSNFKCYGSTMNLKATVTGGLANFKVKYTDGLTIDSVTNYVSGNDFVITPVQSGSYSLMSVTDANGCLSISNSSTATVTVTTTTTISASSDGSRCGAGTVNLSATPSAGIVRWYNTPTGGTSIGSGSPFTTPSISTTTSYYAEAFNNPCVSVTRRKVTAFIGTSLLPAMSGTGTYTIPAGVTTMSVQCWGGGGGGGGARETGSGTARGGGGAGGAYASVTSLAVSAGEIYDFSVGAVGTAGNGNGNGSNGGDSYFVLSGVDKVRAKGGTFGFGTLNGNGNGGTAALVSASVGTLKNAGGNGATATNSGSGGGGGAAGVAGTGGAGAVTLGGASQSGGSDKGGNGLTAHTTTGNSGVGVGAGGGGAFASAGGSNSTTAGAGQAGQIILTISAPTISYTGSPYCKSVTSALVTIVGIQGWQFIAPVGLTIDAATGEINPSTSTAGTYQIIYRDPCGAADVTTNVTITDLPVVTSSSSICIGSTTSILTPTTGGTWTSSNTGFASVTNAGVVTGVAAGSPTFTFLNTTTNCSNTTSAVTVNALPVVTSGSSICVGSTTSILTPTTGGTWTSSNTGFATVTNAGVVTGVAAGSPTFTFLNTTTGCSKTTSAVTVNALPVVTSASSICIGSTTSILTPTTGGTWTSSNTGFATVTNAGVVTGVAAGSPTFTFLNTTTNCSNTTSAVTVNALPVVSVTGSSSICVGGTSSLSPTTGGTWTSSNTGFATVTNTGVVTAVAAGSPTFTFLNTTTGCSKTTSAITINTNPTTATIAGSATICSGNTTNLTVTMTGGSGLYTVNYSGGTLTNYASGTNIVVSPTVNTTYTLSSVTDANGCAAQSLINNAIVTLDAPGKWVGSTSDWHTASNWCGNAVPSITTDVTINSGSTAIISSGDAAVNSITIGSGMSVQVNNSRKLFVYGNWINAGVFTSGTSTVEFAKSGIQTISNTNSGTESFYNLSLNGSGTKTISSGTNVNILPSGALIFASGISLDVNNQILTLKSGVSVSPDYIDNTARLVAMPSGAGFVNASNFKVERYIPSGKRTVRFLSSPVSGATVADWNNSFYITGSKASYPDNITLNSTISTITDYTESLNGLSSQKFTEVYGLGTVLLPGKGYRAFIRGGKDIDLSNPLVAPVATATTLSVKGLPNVGDITRNLTYTNHSKLSDDGWNLVGNPYPSQIDWDLISVSERVNVPNSFSIFDPRLGTNGAYYTYAGGGVGTPARSNPSIIPSSQSFFVKLSSAGAGSITFKEFQKSTLSHRGNFRIAHDNLLRISISDTGTFDETVVQLLEGSSEAFDSEYDAQKLSNAGINIFTVSSKGDNLAINRTPLTSSMNIRLGVSNRYKGTHTFKFSNDPSFADAKLYLEDKYLRKVTQVVDGGEYFFDITSDVNSSGIDRFVLTNQPTVVTSTDNSFLSGKVALKVYPNPTDGKQIHLDLYASMKGNVKLKITDLSGKVVYTRDLGSANDLSFTHYVINDLKDLANGVYVVNCEGETSNFKSIFTIAK